MYFLQEIAWCSLGRYLPPFRIHLPPFQMDLLPIQFELLPFENGLLADAATEVGAWSLPNRVCAEVEAKAEELFRARLGTVG